MRHVTHRRPRRWVAFVGALSLLLAACGAENDGDEPGATGQDTEEAGAAEPSGPITVYSGRNEELVGSIFDDFTAETGIEVEVRYGDTAELAATILEEGDASPADVYVAQDAGALGALEAEGILAALPDDVLDLVDPLFRSRDGNWTGTTGRVRVLGYNTDALDEDEVPDTVVDLTDPEWEGRIGWAPTNGSFQAFVTAMRIEEGDETTREWLEGIIANDPAEFENNTAIVEGLGRGEVEVGLVNHYYLARFLAEDPDFPVDNKYLPGDIGGLVNIAGAGVLASSEEQDAATELIRYLLSEEVQTHFGQVTDALEFPVRDGIESPELPSLEEIDPPDVDLSDLEDLQGTLEMLREVGALA